ncbi:MAG: DUF3109 family protein [Bacteroidales bacterium]|nr:DUF3109 family protein [Bacteroidales bacterium]
MIIVQNSIVSDDVADQRFGCDLMCCKGACCVDGDSGAPLMEEEVAKLEAVLPEALPRMTEAGRAAVASQGVAVRDKDGDLGTPLIDGGACAFIAYSADGCALCALQELYKPVSCHLYPIRVEDYGEFTAVNYHQWDICRPAKGKGEPLYITLREPLVRRFGQEWYDELVEQINLRNNGE